MPLANRLYYLFKDLKYGVADGSLEGFVFLWGHFLLDGLNTLIHLTIDAEEHFKDVFRNLRLFKQGFLREIVDSLEMIAQCLINALSGQVKFYYGTCPVIRLIGT